MRRKERGARFRGGVRVGKELNLSSKGKDETRKRPEGVFYYWGGGGAVLGREELFLVF